MDIFETPYSEALDINISPVYDTAHTIYSKLFTRLDAIADINVNETGFTEGDLVYYGDMNKWKTLQILWN